jgi:hypothetical protein
MSKAVSCFQISVLAFRQVPSEGRCRFENSNKALTLIRPVRAGMKKAQVP